MEQKNMKSHKIKKGESTEDIMKLTAGENVNKVFENIDDYEDYFLNRFAKAVGGEAKTCELIQLRKGEETHVMYLDREDFKPVMLDRFEKARAREDYDRAAKWKILMNILEGSK